MKLETSNKRLLKLAEFLRALPRKRFDYSTWVGDDWKGKQDLSCGTKACALGWAASMPEFRRLGLHLGPGGTPMLTPGRRDPFRKWGTDAGAEVFGLTFEEATDLFQPTTPEEWDATPKQVARKIEKFVKTRSKRSISFNFQKQPNE